MHGMKIKVLTSYITNRCDD